MKQLLLVFHAPSENTQKMFEAMKRSVLNSGVTGITLVAKSPFDTQPQDVLDSDAVILGTTENLGYMSGALKDFFDRIYYPVLEEKQGLPVAAVVRAGHDGTGTCRALATITTGLKWRWVQEVLVCRGEWKTEFVALSGQLAEAMAVALDEGMI